MAVDFSLFVFALYAYFSLFRLDVVHTPHNFLLPFVLALKVFLLLRPNGIPVGRCLGIPALPFSYCHSDSRSLFARVGMRVDLLHGSLRSVFCTFKRNTGTKSLVKIIMYNATCTNSHIYVEEHLVPFPPVAHLKSGPNNRSSRPSYSHRPAVACDTDSPKRDCSHWPSLSGVSSGSAHGLGLFRYGGREKLTQKLMGLARPDLNRFVIRR